MESPLLTYVRLLFEKSRVAVLQKSGMGSRAMAGGPGNIRVVSQLMSAQSLEAIRLTV